MGNRKMKEWAHSDTNTKLDLGFTNEYLEYKDPKTSIKIQG
jgi:hypothetical protein